MSGLRVVLDTNVILSGLAYPASIPGRIVQAWQQGGIEIMLSRYILDETARVLPRMSKTPLSADQIRTLADSLLFLAEIVEPVIIAPATIVEDALRDPADLPILATFLAAKADYLITGDKDLLALKTKYPIVTPAEFWQRHGG